MSIAENLQRINDKIARACQRVNRNPGEITLLAVTKYSTDDSIRELISLGLTECGENRIQQARVRLERFPNLDWHFIGSLQTNKVKYCRQFTLIHSLDRFALASELNRYGEKWQRKVNTLIQVNVAGEESKHGISLAQAKDLALAVKEHCPMVNVLGLMTMAPYGPCEQARPHFRRLRQLSDELSELMSWESPVLSMGMSNDFEVAIEEGATLIRVGSALFADEEG